MPDITSEPRTREAAPGPPWIKSSFSFANGDCVEAALLPGDLVGLRDTKDRVGAVLRFTLAEWTAFIAGVQAGEFSDLSAGA
jgi:Domain of unknown function (DUF397)